VVDSVSFEGQEQGVSMGRVPDGSLAWQRLAAKNPGAPNGSIRLKTIVINELMRDPISQDPSDQYVELYNRGATTVNLGNWQFITGISYIFPTNAVLAPGGYLVVAANPAHLIAAIMRASASSTNQGGGKRCSGMLNAPAAGR
jgi:hypothetical protein